MGSNPKMIKPRVVVILAGGRGERLGGVDKGAVLLNDQPLIDHVLARVKPQADEVFISGHQNYGTGLKVIRDLLDGPLGPAAGLWAAVTWLQQNRPHIKGFFTVPVDAPFVSTELLDKLYQENGSAIINTGERLHPTFAYWRCADLSPVLTSLGKDGFPLRQVAGLVGAVHVAFEGDSAAFTNINTPEQLRMAKNILCKK